MFLSWNRDSWNKDPEQWGLNTTEKVNQNIVCGCVWLWCQMCWSERLQNRCSNFSHTCLMSTHHEGGSSVSGDWQNVKTFSDRLRRQELNETLVWAKQQQTYQKVSCAINYFLTRLEGFWPILNWCLRQRDRSFNIALILGALSFPGARFSNVWSQLLNQPLADRDKLLLTDHAKFGIRR